MLLRTLAILVGTWAVRWLGVLLTLNAVGVHASLGAALVYMTVTGLANTAPILPGNAGVYQGAAVGALAMVGHAGATAVAASLVMPVMASVITACAAVVGIALYGRRFMALPRAAFARRYLAAGHGRGQTPAMSAWADPVGQRLDRDACRASIGRVSAVAPERYLADLNPAQREAVRTTEGPLLVVAGAGSGKTRVLTYRVAHLIAACGVKPTEILAITFTNKAAGEMRERLEGLLGGVARAIWILTFHAACGRILRREAPRLGYRSNFTIYDQADQVRLTSSASRSSSATRSASSRAASTRRSRTRRTS